MLLEIKNKPVYKMVRVYKEDHDILTEQKERTRIPIIEIVSLMVKRSFKQEKGKK